MKNWTLRWVERFCVMALLLGVASGCSWSVGGSKKTETCAMPAPAKATRGQELIDLKKARDQGALTEDEYQAQKKRILEK